MKNNQYTATPNWFDKVQQTDDSVSTGNTYVTNFGSILLLSGLTDLVIEITGEEDGNGLSPEVSWNKEESKLSFVKTKFLKEGDPVVDADYVTTIADNPQDILSNKDFINGLSINKHRFFEKDGILYLDGNLALTGGLVIYADNPEGGGDPGPGFGGGTILDISITGEGNVLSDVSLSEDKTILQFVKTNIEFSGNYVDFTSDQDISGVKNFTNGIKLNGNRLYNDNGVIYLEGDLAVTGGITTFATAGRKVSTIMDGVVADEVTITVAEKDGVKQLSLKEGVGGGLTSAIITGTGNAVTDVTLEDEGKTLNLIKDKTFLIPSDLLGYAKEDWVTNQLLNYVTLNTEQDITTIKNFLEGITIGSSKKKFYEKDGVLYIDSDVAFTGGITTYATDGVTVSTIMDGIATDEVTITKGEDNVLRIKNAGSGSDFDATKMWKALAEEDNTKQINKSHLTTALKDYATITELNKKWTLDDEKIANWDDAYDKRHTHSNKTVLDGITAAKVTNWDTAFSWGNHATFGYAHLAGEETFTGLKHFTEGLTVGAGKHKLYEKDGVVYFDGDLAVTGGITQYATDGASVSTIMDGVTADEVTITKGTDNVLRIKNAGSGSSFDKATMWAALAANTTEPIHKSHLTTALQGYATEEWVTAKNYAVKSTTLAGYGITDAYTKTESDSKYPTKTGGGASGTWGININGSADRIVNKGNITAISGTTTFGEGLYLYKVYDNGYPCDYGNLLRIGGIGLGELLSEWTGDSSTGHLFYRSKRDVSTQAWSNWKKVAFTDDTVANADKLDNIHANGFCRAYSASYSFGENQNLITTAQFVEKLKSLGAFNQPYWMCKGSWYYAGNQIISDSGYGNIQLAGAVIEVMGWEIAYTIRITTAPTTTNGARNSIFIYQNHGEAYEPRWIKVAMTFDNVYSADKLSVYASNNVNNPNWDEYKATIENFGANATGIPPVGDNANSVLNIPMSKHGTNKMYGFQMAFCSNNENIFARAWKSGNIGSWYGIPMVVSGRLKKGFSSVECTDWFRSHGNTGWYSETWGGGIYMNDSTWVRTYNGKNFKSDNVVEAGTWLSAGTAVNVFDPVGNSWNNGQGAFQIGIPNDDNQTPILVAYNGPANSSSGTNRYFAIEVLNTGTRDVHFCVTGAETVRMRANHFEVNGNILATGGITQYSDQRAKTIIEQITLSLKDIAQSPAIRFKWNNWKQKDDGKTHIGGIALYIQTILPEAIYNSDGAFTMDYATTGYIFAVNTAKHLLDYETKTDKEINKLKKRIKYLEKQLKKLGYEEANVVDN